LRRRAVRLPDVGAGRRDASLKRLRRFEASTVQPSMSIRNSPFFDLD
jgi:hypothetical protein